MRVLPARAGMSPHSGIWHPGVICAPRTGGDEPETKLTMEKLEKCSPHGRG